MKSGVVFGIQFFSVHDGPGIRTAVFLKGCNLRCAWCHNPESLDWHREISVARSRCINCGSCVQACPAGLHRKENGQVLHFNDIFKCLGCGACETACPTASIRMMGRRMNTQEVLAEVEKDRRYYGTEGGLTITGGEPTVQFPFTLELAKAAFERGIRVFIETNATADQRMYEELLPWVSGFLIDYKLTDEEEHRRWTGMGNQQILANIEFLARTGKDIVLRCPLIPGVNDTELHFRGIARISQRNPQLRGVEIMPYHRLGISKARQIGWKDEQIREFTVPDAAQIREWKERIRALGGRLIQEE